MLVLPLAAGRRPPRSVAILGNAAGTTARAYGPLLPADPDRRRRDRRRDHRGRPRAASTWAPAPAHATPRTRGRGCAAPSDRYDAIVDRRLPAAVHPVLPGDEGVLPARARPARAGRRGDHQRRPPRRLDEAGKVLAATMRAVFGADRVFRDESAPNAARIVAARALCSLVEPSGWPTLTTATPPGASGRAPAGRTRAWSGRTGCTAGGTRRSRSRPGGAGACAATAGRPPCSVCSRGAFMSNSSRPTSVTSGSISTASIRVAAGSGPTRGPSCRPRCRGSPPTSAAADPPRAARAGRPSSRR